MTKSRVIKAGTKQRKRDKDKTLPTRRCFVTGVETVKSELVRFVVGPDGNIVPDLEGKLPGRGLWLSARRDVVNTAEVKNLFARAAKQRVGVPEGIADRVEELLVRRCQNLVGLARRAGNVVSGYEKVRILLEEDKASLLLAASDGAEAGRKKLKNLAPHLKEWAELTGSELASALGRETVVHVAVSHENLVGKLAEELTRLHGFRAVSGEN